MAPGSEQAGSTTAGGTTSFGGEMGQLTHALDDMISAINAIARNLGTANGGGPGQAPGKSPEQGPGQAPPSKPPTDPPTGPPVSQRPPDAPPYTPPSAPPEGPPKSSLPPTLPPDKLPPVPTGGGTGQTPGQTPGQVPTQSPVQQSPVTVTLSNDDGRDSAKLIGSNGSFVELWGDPHVVIQEAGKAEPEKFEIGFGDGEIGLSDGSKVRWTTRDDHVLRSFQIDSPGDAYDRAIDTDDNINENGLSTSLTDAQLRELADALRTYKGPMDKPLTKVPPPAK